MPKFIMGYLRPIRNNNLVKNIHKRSEQIKVIFSKHSVMVSVHAMFGRCSSHGNLGQEYLMC